MSFWSEIGTTILGGIGVDVGGNLANQGMKIAGIPTPGQPDYGAMAKGMDTLYPGTTAWERLGGNNGMGSIGSAEQAGQFARQAKNRELRVAEKSADANIALTNAKEKQQENLNKLMDKVIDLIWDKNNPDQTKIESAADVAGDWLYEKMPTKPEIDKGIQSGYRAKTGVMGGGAIGQTGIPTWEQIKELYFKLPTAKREQIKETIRKFPIKAYNEEYEVDTKK